MRAVSNVEHALVDEVTELARASAETQVFVSLLAHELRTRLKVIECALASGDEESARLAGQSTGALQELVEDLLELARPRPDARADAGEAMDWVVEDLGDGAAADIVVVGALPTVALPMALLRSVLRNLLLNAIEAGAFQVEVFARADGTICVRDDGPGVPPAVAARIFGAYSGKLGGAGLGLALCREILRRRGGELWLEGSSTFCFRVG